MFASRWMKSWSGKAAIASLLACAIPAHAGNQLDTIDAVNWTVNSLPLTDCKSFAFEKVARLHAKGIEGRFTAVIAETGGYHAIVIVNGNIALDDRFKRLMTVQELRERGYRIAPLKPPPSP